MANPGATNPRDTLIGIQTRKIDDPLSWLVKIVQGHEPAHGNLTPPKERHHELLVPGTSSLRSKKS